MRVVRDYGRDRIAPTGCGALALEDKVYVNSGTATSSDIYVLDAASDQILKHLRLAWTGSDNFVAMRGPNNLTGGSDRQGRNAGSGDFGGYRRGARGQEGRFSPDRQSDARLSEWRACGQRADSSIAEPAASNGRAASTRRATAPGRSPRTQGAIGSQLRQVSPVRWGRPSRPPARQIREAAQGGAAKALARPHGVLQGDIGCRPA